VCPKKDRKKIKYSDGYRRKKQNKKEGNRSPQQQLGEGNGGGGLKVKRYSKIPCKTKNATSSFSIRLSEKRERGGSKTL